MVWYYKIKRKKEDTNSILKKLKLKFNAEFCINRWKNNIEGVEY